MMGFPQNSSSTAEMALVTVSWPGGQRDFTVPLSRSVRLVIPELLRLAEIPLGDNSTSTEASWNLGRPDGKPFPKEATLTEIGVQNGHVLVLSLAGASPAEPPSAEAPITEAPEAAANPLARSRVRLPSRLIGVKRLIAAMRLFSAGPVVKAAPRIPSAPGHICIDPAALTVKQRETLSSRMRAAWRETDYIGRLNRLIATPQLSQSVTIAVVSPKGGVGKTTITALLGMLLAVERRDRIVAIDTNPDFGSLGRTLTPNHNVFVDDLFHILSNQALTVTGLDTHLGRATHGLMVIPAPTDPDRMARLNEAAYREVIRHLKDLVGVLVLDCGTGLQDPASRAALSMADQIVLVSDADPAAASLVAESCRILSQTGVPIWLVVNKRPAKGSLLNLEALAGLVTNIQGLSVVPFSPQAATQLSAGQFTWHDAPLEWQESLRELGVLLTSAWADLGLTRKPNRSEKEE